MGDVIGAFKIAILTYILGLFACGLVGVIVLIIRKITSNREKEIEQT
jgi:hypothetical protein